MRELQLYGLSSCCHMTDDIKTTPADVSNASTGLGWMRAACTIVMGCVGVGILALPGTATRSGWLGSLIGLAFAAAVTFYNNILLWKTLHLAADGEHQVVRCYEEAVRATYGTAVSIYSGVVIHVSLASVCCAMLILMGSTSHAMTRVLDKRIWVLIWTAVGIPFSWIKEVKDVGLVAAVGVTSASAMVIIIIAASADKMLTDGIPEEIAVIPRGAIDFLSNLATYFFVFSFTVTSPTVCYHMIRPMDFPRTLIAAMIFIPLVYMSVMELGYAAYGQSLSEVDTIVDAISPPGQPLDVFGWLINIVILVVMLPHFLVLFTPTAKQIDVLCSNVGERRQWSASHTKIACLVGRNCLVILDGCIAIVVPKVSSLVSLIGAICVTQNSILFPIACYVKIKRQHQYPFPKWEVPLLVLLFVIGLMVIVIGLYGAVVHFGGSLNKFWGVGKSGRLDGIGFSSFCRGSIFPNQQIRPPSPRLRRLAALCHVFCAYK